jgi:hypothetical protein
MQIRDEKKSGRQITINYIITKNNNNNENSINHFLIHSFFLVQIFK